MRNRHRLDPAGTASDTILERFMSTIGPKEQRTAGSYLEVWKLAYPAILTMLSQTIMWMVDSAMVGRVGKVDLAAVGLGGIMVWTIYSFFVGLTFSIATYVSQYYGAGKYKACAKNLWQGLYVAAGAGILIYIVRAFNPHIVELLGPAEDVKSRTLAYADIRMLSAPFVIIQSAYSNFFRGIGNTRTPMKVIAFANLVNIVGDYFFIFGKGPFPALGVAGAAWATSLANLLAAIVFVVISFSRLYREKYSVHKNLGVVPVEMGKLLRVGIPVAIHNVLDMGSFLVFFGYIGRIGTESLAANQIIIQILALSFMPCQGFSVAATTLMGQYIGAKSLDLAKKSAYSSLKLGLLYSLFIALCYILLSKQLVRIFTSDPTVVSLGVRIILMAALFQIFDAIQMISSGALLGAGDTKVPMVLTVCCAWFLFLPLAYLFGTVIGGGVVGAWIGATLYIIILGIVMFARLHRERWAFIKI
jgi:MATE family multidrug resistance protein